MKVLVTGASGFIGTHLVPLLVARGHDVTAASRKRLDIAGVTWRLSPELGSGSDWSRALQGVEAIVHLAGRAQNGPENESEEGVCRRINTEGTARLAHQAAESGVRRFLFLSSIHAVAAESDEVITAQTVPRPSSAYGRSKLAAEEAVQQELEGTACAWTILRPPAVYGSGHASSFSQLAKLAASGIPLPLASVRNRRSFIYVENLADVIATCLRDPKSFGRVYLPSDGEDVSTPELMRAMARANAGGDEGGKRKTLNGLNAPHASLSASHFPRLWPFPESILKAASRLPALGALRKMTSSLYVDIEPLRRDLGWRPPFSMAEGLSRTLEAGSPGNNPKH